MKQNRTNPGWGDDLHLATANWIADQGTAWRLHWVDQPAPGEDPDGFEPHYAWQHREHGDGATKVWVTKSRHASMQQFAEYHGVAVPA